MHIFRHGRQQAVSLLGESCATEGPRNGRDETEANQEATTFRRYGQRQALPRQRFYCL